MNNIDKNKLMMFRTVKSVLETPAYQTIWSTLPAYVSDYAEFNNGVTELELLAMPLNKRGATHAKGDEKEKVCEVAFAVAAAIRAYAARRGLAALAARVDFTRTDLNSGRDLDTAARCRQVHTAGKEHVADLADYKVDDAKLAQLAQAISNFEAAALQPRVYRATGKTRTRAISEKVAFLDRFLVERLDGLTETFRTAHPLFVQDYRNARVIQDIAATHPGSAEDDDVAEEFDDESANQPSAAPTPPVDYGRAQKKNDRNQCR